MNGREESYLELEPPRLDEVNGHDQRESLIHRHIQQELHEVLLVPHSHTVADPST